MSSRTPQDKKRLSYKHDHRVRGGENDKAFRKKWPVKKRKAIRAFRHAAEAITRAAVTHDEAEVDTRLVKRRRLQKWGVQTLEETVSSALEKRARNAGAKKRRREARNQPK